MTSRSIRFLLLAALLLSTHSTATAAPRLRMMGDAAGSTCNVANPGLGGVTRVYVQLAFATEATGVAFRAPLPANSGYVYAADETIFMTSGISQAGVQVSLGACLSGTINVMQILLIKTSNQPCSFMPALPYPGDDTVIYTDCTFAEHPALPVGAGAVLSSDGTAACMTTPAHNPSPPHGADNVSLVPGLSWDFIPPECADISGRDDTLYFGTSANPPLYEEFVSPPHQVGPLQPGVTYFWKVKIRGYGSLTESPVWSFTTDAPVKVEATTWGAIKALYR